MSFSSISFPRIAWAVLLAATFAMTGCVGMLAQITRVAGGDMNPAEFKGLKGKKIAVVAISQGSTYGPGSEATMIGARIERLLTQEIRDVEIVNQDRIADWIDQNNWNEVDYVEIGKGLGVDMVVAVDIEQYSLVDGPTLFKGSADYSVKVFDFSRKGDKVVWSKTPPTYEFPKNGRFRDTTSRQKFERAYVDMLAKKISRHFYAYPYADDVATDALSIDL